MRKLQQFLCPGVIMLTLGILTGCTSPAGDSGKGAGSVDLTSDEASESTLAINASQYGVGYPETFVLMQNRMGVRIEYCLDRSNLQLWISPQAGKSMSYVDRNWSNRDDHTNIFDRILIPGLDLARFDSCQWDPFHSKLYFGAQVLHLAQVYDQPMVLVWFDQSGAVDFKSYGHNVMKQPYQFYVGFTDRGRDFQSAAAISDGPGVFQYMPEDDQGRSSYVRAHLEPGQFLVIGSELEKEMIRKKVWEISHTQLQGILERNEELIARDLSTGLFRLKDHPEMQKLMDISRRVALSMQDFNGFMRSTNQYIYYLLWYRDGGMNTAHIGYTGWIEPAFDQARFALMNPNTNIFPPEGKFFGQVMGGPITKWEEDGLFYVLWPAFTYWTQTGDDVMIREGLLETAKEAMRWLEDYCYDKEMGLFGRYYYCETPLSDSRDDGWDNATGAPTGTIGVMYKGHRIIRSYDLYINLLNYANYIMLSAMSEGEEAESYFRKAAELEKRFVKLYHAGGSLPGYGVLQTDRGEMVQAEPYGLDIWDYVWGLSLPPFTPTLPEEYRALREQVATDMTTTGSRYFICVYSAMLTSMDPLIHDEERIMAALERLMPESVRPGRYLPMPYAVPELIHIEDGDPFHDVRPLVYSIAPWMSAITNLGVRRLPFGIALRPTRYLEGIDNYLYQKGEIDISYEGEGAVAEILVNGQLLEGSYQVPDLLVREGENRIVVRMGTPETAVPVLASSTVKLLSVEGGTYRVEAFGKNVLTFKDLDREAVIRNESGEVIGAEVKTMDNLTYLEFEGRGLFTVKI
jgi:hypothetical protein